MSSRKRRREAARRGGQAASAALSIDSRRLAWIVAALTFFVFLPALGGEFLNWDDDRNFLDNPHFRGLAPHNLRWMFSTFLLGHYHPLTWLTLGADYTLWGMNPAGYHFTNLALHAGTAALVYLLFVELLRRGRKEEKASAPTRIAAAAGALLFSLHPLRVESVAWITERRDVLSGLFAILTVLLYVRGRRAWSVLAYAAALSSKVIAATLPLALLAVDLYPLGRKLGWRMFADKLPYFALAAAAALVGVGRYEAGVAGAVADLDVHFGLRIALSLYGVAFYLWKTLVPVGLYPLYAYSLDPQPSDALLLTAAAAAIALTLAAVVLRKRAPSFSAAWAIYVVTLLPVLSLIRLDPQQYVADHHSYLATLGFAALGAGALSALLAGPRARAGALGAGAALLVLSSLTVRQIGVWENSLTLWSYAAEGQPLSLIARNNLGRAQAEAGDLEAAMVSFRRAVELKPDYAHARYNLGNLLMRRGDLAEAETQLRRAVEIEPRNAQARSDLGNCLLRLGRGEEALEQYREALETAPGFADCRFNLALALETLGRSEAAADEYRALLRVDPANEEARRRLAALEGRRAEPGRRDKAAPDHSR